MASGRRLSWLPTALLAAVALAMIALILVPARLWSHPTHEAVYRGLDRNLIYENVRGSGSADGQIDNSPGSLTLTAVPGSDPTVDLLTTPLGFQASMDVRVVQPPSGGALRVGIWSPSVEGGYFLEFGPSPADHLTVVALAGGHGSITLVGGTVRSTRDLGAYVPGETYRISLALDKQADTITTAVSGPTSRRGDSPLVSRTSINSQDFPDLFKAFRPTLAASLSTSGGTAVAAIDNVIIALPSQPSSAGELVETISDDRATAATVLLAACGVLAILIALGTRFQRALRDRSDTSKYRTTRRPVSYARFGVLAVGAMAYIAFNGWLFHLGTPHFDVYSAKIWSYIAANYNFADLYHRPLLVPAAGVEAGSPIHEAGFPYGPTKVFYYLIAGWLYRLAFGQPNALIDTWQFEALLKGFNVAFGILDAMVIYLILERIGVKATSVPKIVALFVLNPALIFIMSVWGSTETVSLFFVLASVWFALRAQPSWAWITLGVGAFTRPQMLILAFLLGCVYLRVFSAGRSLRAISWAVITFFVLVAPLAVAISPSFALDYVTHVVGFQIGTGQADSYSAVSPGYYSIWTLPLLYIQNQHGVNRMWYPRTADLIGGISYSTAGAVIVTVFLLAIGAAILTRRPRGTIQDYLPLVALGMLGWLMLSTSLISRYFLYGLILVILCRGAYRGPAYYLSVIWLTAVTLITSWSHFGLDILGSDAAANPLNPLNSPLTRGVQWLFFNDRFITDATAGNLIALVVLGTVALGARPKPTAVEESSPLQGVAAT